MKKQISQQLHTYRFSNGDVITSTLPKEEFMKRMNRLDTLRVLVEGFVFDKGDESYNEIANSIYHKALNAYNKTNLFTGIIRLSFTEKDWLGYLLESDMLDEEDKDVIKYYIKMS